MLVKDGGERGQKRLRRETWVSFKCFLKENNLDDVLGVLSCPLLRPSFDEHWLPVLSVWLPPSYTSCKLSSFETEFYTTFCLLLWFKSLLMKDCVYSGCWKMKPFISSPPSQTQYVCYFFWHFNISDDLMALFFVLKKGISETNNSFALVGFSYRSTVG